MKIQNVAKCEIPWISVKTCKYELLGVKLREIPLISDPPEISAFWIKYWSPNRVFAPGKPILLWFLDQRGVNCSLFFWIFQPSYDSLSKTGYFIQIVGHFYTEVGPMSGSFDLEEEMGEALARIKHNLPCTWEQWVTLKRTYTRFVSMKIKDP